MPSRRLGCSGFTRPHYGRSMSDADLPLIYRLAELDDAQDMVRVELAAQALLAEQGVHLHRLSLPDGIDEPTAWVLALVEELDGPVVGVARLTELEPSLVCLDQVFRSTLNTPTAASGADSCSRSPMPHGGSVTPRSPGLRFAALHS
jgi:hypothetical protein